MSTLPKSRGFRAGALLALTALIHGQLSAAPEDAIRQGSPGIPNAAGAIGSLPGRSTGQVNERTGAFTYEYPIAVPPGRLGMEPKLALSYSSDSPLVGGVAAGWSLPLPEIRRDPVAGFGKLWTSPQGRLYEYEEPGAVAQRKHYRAWGDGTYTRFTRVDENRWESRTSDGVVHRLERVTGAPVDDRYVLVSSADRFGNTIRYQRGLVTSPSGLVADQLTAIEYTSNDQRQIGPHARVTFGYEPMSICGNSITPVGARLLATSSGALMLRDASKLTQIRTEVRDTPGGGFRTVREIRLSYRDPGCDSGGAVQTPVRLLESIDERARSPEGIWTSVPPTSFQYGNLASLATVDRDGENYNAGGHPIYTNAIGYGVGPRRQAIGAGTWDWNEVWSALIDIDGDGDQDRLVAGRYEDGDGSMRLNDHCTALLYRNVDGRHFSEFAYPVVLPRQWHGKYCTLSSQPKFPPAGSRPPGEPTVANGEESPISVSRFLDIDGDGLVDLVSAVFLPTDAIGDNDQYPHHPNCDPGVQNPSWVVCGGPGDSVRPEVFPPRSPYVSYRRNQYYNGHYVWRWYRNVGGYFDDRARFVRSPIPLDLVRAARSTNEDIVTEEFAVVDLTGDGLLDAVWTAQPGTTGWTIWPGDGQGNFADIRALNLRWEVPPSVRALRETRHVGFSVAAGGLSHDYLATSLLDVDRDGRLDLVTKDPSGQVRALAYLNHGRGFSAMPVTLLPDDQRSVERLLGAYSTTPTGATLFERVQERRLADINGDGILDRIEFLPQGKLNEGGGTVSVALGFGPTLGHPARVTTGVTSFRGFATGALSSSTNLLWLTHGEMLDMDGDGYEDFVGGLQLFGLPESARTHPPGLLTRIHSGRDATTTIQYAPRSDSEVVNCSVPIALLTPCVGVAAAPRRVVRSVTVSSAARTAPAVTSYRYVDPVVARDELEFAGFRGFGRVEITSPSHGSVNGVERRATSRLDFNYSLDHRGLLVGKRVLDEEQRLLRLEEHEYVKVQLTSRAWGPNQIHSFVPSVDRSWTCIRRAGPLADQERQCREDPGLETTHKWGPLTVASTTHYTLWAEGLTRRTALAGDAPARFEEVTRELVSNDDHYLLLTSTVTRRQADTRLTHEVFEYEQQPLSLPLRTRTWLHDDVYAVEMRRHDPGTGVLLWVQKPEQYRRDPTAADDQRIKTSYAYDPYHLYARSVTNELGHVVASTHDLGTGVVVGKQGPNSWTAPTCTSGCVPVFERTQIDIDGFGRVIRTSKTDDHPTAGYELKVASTTTYLDELGRPGLVDTSTYQVLGSPENAIQERTEIDGTGLVKWSVRYGTLGGAYRSFQYNPAGSLQAALVPDPTNDDSQVRYRFEYDALGRELRRERPDGAALTSSYEGPTVVRSEVAAHGDLDPGSLATTTATMDGFGDLRTVTEMDEPAPARTTYSYDGVGRVREIIDADGNSTVLEHDGAGRRTAVRRAGRVWRYGYDDNGNQITEEAPHTDLQDPARFTMSTVYDFLDRPISRVQGGRDLTPTELALYGDGRTTWVYDIGKNGIGRVFRTQVSSGASNVITHTYRYDAFGNAQSEDLQFSIWNGAFFDSRRVLRQFDATGKLREVSHADGAGDLDSDGIADPGTLIDYSYDSRGLPQFVDWSSRPVDGTLVSTRAATLHWNVAGLLRRRDNERHQQLWSYDANARVREIAVLSRPNAAAPWSPVTSQTIDYWSADDVKSIWSSAQVAADGSSFEGLWQFGYDFRHQLAAVNGPSYESLFTHTPAGRLKSAYVLGGEHNYRDAKYEYPQPGQGDPETVQRIWDSTEEATYHWDLAGNQTRRSRSNQFGTYDQLQFRYDGADKLREARGVFVSEKKGSAVYWYDTNGQRVLALGLDRYRNPIWLKFWFDDVEIHYGPGGNITSTFAYIDAGGPPLARVVDRSAIEYTFSNHLDSILATVGDDGVASAAFNYSPFGELVQAIGPASESFRRRFNGKEDDYVTGLQYYGARYYDDYSFTWTQPDPLYNVVPEKAETLPRRANRYAFSLNNPVRYLDPDGRDILFQGSLNQVRPIQRALQQAVGMEAVVIVNPNGRHRNEFVIRIVPRDTRAELSTTTRALVDLSRDHRRIMILHNANMTDARTPADRARAAADAELFNPAGLGGGAVRHPAGGSTGSSVGRVRGRIIAEAAFDFSNIRREVAAHLGGTTEQTEDTIVVHEVVGHGINLCKTERCAKLVENIYRSSRDMTTRDLEKD